MSNGARGYVFLIAALILSGLLSGVASTFVTPRSAGPVSVTPPTGVVAPPNVPATPAVP